MITLSTTRHYAEAALHHFFPFINHLKQTRLNDVAHAKMVSKEYLHVVVINCLLDEIEHLFRKKLVNTKGGKIKLQFSDAQGVLLYQFLLNMPIDEKEIFQNMVRSQWLVDLDQAIIAQQIYQHNHPVKPSPPKRSTADFYEV